MLTKAPQPVARTKTALNSLPTSPREEALSPKSEVLDPPSAMSPTDYYEQLFPSGSIPLEQIGKRLRPYARIESEGVKEVSGMTKSKRYPNLFWVHNDSGSQPEVFPIDRQGRSVVPPWLKNPEGSVPVRLTANIDWESISSTPEELLIVDMGNNSNARQDLGVYVVSEPNPQAVSETRHKAFIPIKFPSQFEFPPQSSEWNVDCEASFQHEGSLYILTKHRKLGQPLGALGKTRLLRLNLSEASTDQTNELEFLGEKDGLGGWVTGADISSDGKHIAILCHAPQQSVWLFENKDGEVSLDQPVGRFPFHGAGQVESLCFEDDKKMIITNEQGELFSLSLDDFKAAE